MLLNGVQIAVGCIFFVRGDRMLLNGVEFAVGRIFFVQGYKMLLGGFILFKGTECC
jgi:hypothetical protein